MKESENLISEGPKFWVDRSSKDLEASQNQRVGLTRVLVTLDYPESWETNACLALDPELKLVDSPSCHAAWLADSAELFLRVEVAVAIIQRIPYYEVIWPLEPPTRHNRASLHHGCSSANRVNCRLQTPSIHELEAEEGEGRVAGLSESVRALKA